MCIPYYVGEWKREIGVNLFFGVNNLLNSFNVSDFSSAYPPAPSTFQKPLALVMT